MQSFKFGIAICALASMCLLNSSTVANEATTQSGETVSVSGTVTSEAGGELPKKCLVVATDSSGKVVSATVVADGKFFFAKLPRGVINVTIKKDAASVSNTVAVDTAGNAAPVELKLFSGTAKGKVCDPQGTGIPGAHVMLSTGKDLAGGFRIVTTDKDGQYAIDLVADGEHVINVSAKGYRGVAEKDFKVKDQLADRNFTLFPISHKP